MKKFFTSEILRTAAASLVMVISVLAIVAPVSCRLTEEGIEIFPADTTAPTVEEFSVTGSRTILIACSEKIVLDEISVIELTVENASLLETGGIADDGDVFAVANVISYSESMKAAEVELSASTEVGKSYIFSGVVYDTTGNSLEFSQKFFGYNENPARLLFNEVRSTYNKQKVQTEFVEFYVVKGGNTYGLEMVSAANGESKKYSFPAIEVKTGELITLHGRTIDGTEDSALDELGEDLTLSKTCESSDDARDLWKSGDEKIVSQTDVLVIRDSVSLEIKDALLMSASGKTEWTKKLMIEFATKAYELGIWKDGSLPENAVCTDGTTSSLLRSVSRQNTALIAGTYSNADCLPDYIPSSAEDWIVTEKQVVDKVTVSGATPGYENSTNMLNLNN